MIVLGSMSITGAVVVVVLAGSLSSGVVDAFVVFAGSDFVADVVDTGLAVADVVLDVVLLSVETVVAFAGVVATGASDVVFVVTSVAPFSVVVVAFVVISAGPSEETVVVVVETGAGVVAAP